MTENEAIKIIKYYYPKKKKFNCGIFTEVHDTECNFGQALNVAIAALEEVQQYREIGTVEECRDAVERARSLDAYVKQVCWERDLAVQQLSEIGISLGENMDTVKEALKKSIKKGDAK